MSIALTSAEQAALSAGWPEFNEVLNAAQRIVAARVAEHESEGWASYAAEQERHAEATRARDAHYAARNKLGEKVDHLEARLADMTREARLSREATEKAVRRLENLRNEIARLHDVYAVTPNEPRCCSDCAALDISDELRMVLRNA